MAVTDWVAAAKLIYDEYNKRNPQKPNFAPVPLSPEQKQLYDVYLKSLMNPATANNSAYVNDIAKQQLQGLSGMKWTSPKTFSGDTGYSGSNTGFTTPWGPGGTSTAPPANPFSQFKPPDVPWHDPNVAPTFGGPSFVGKAAGEDHGGHPANFRESGPRNNTWGDSYIGGDDQSIAQFMLTNPGARDAAARIGNETHAQPPAYYGAQNDPPAGSVEEKAWYSKIDDSWDAFRAAHPHWASLAQNVVTGLLSTFTGAPGGLVSRYLFHRLNADNGTPARASGGGFISGSIGGSNAGRTIGD